MRILLALSILCSLFLLSWAFTSEIPLSLQTTTAKNIKHQVLQRADSSSQLNNRQQSQTQSQSIQTQKKINIVPEHVALMLVCEGLKEIPKGSNDNDSIRKWRATFGIKQPVAWCGIFAGYKSEEGKASPFFKSAWAQAYAITGYTYHLSDIIYGNYTPKPGDWRVKKRTGGGHVETFISWDTANKSGYVIGGNVNDAVTIRKVTLQSMIADGTTYIVDVRGYFNYTTTVSKPITYSKPFYGIATYYADSFNGRKTASGERYHPDSLTAASNTLKIGTRVRVTNAKTNESVVVRINDTGSFRKPVIDLSRAAARRIHVAKTKVKLEVMN